VIKKGLTVLLTTVLAAAAFYQTVFGCTLAVVSGKATPDGRPLLWKNRDSDFEANRVMYFKGEKFDFIGIVNAEDAEGKEVWAGCNSAGFCIANAQSYNINEAAKAEEGEDRRKDEEGLFMKRALAVCATVADFERMLNDTAGDRGIDANFGIIDAQGGAAFFEAGNRTYVRFDAADPRVAPEGYIVRTNFSFTGVANDGAGYIRFDRMSGLFHEAVGLRGIDKDWLLTAASRDMVNGLTGIDPLAGPQPAHSRDRRLFYMSDSIARQTACSTVVLQGVKQGEDPVRTVMWTRLGHPLCSITLPLWVAGGPEMKLTAGESSAPLDRFALYWWERIFPFRGGSRDRYLDLAPLYNAAGDGILHRLIAIEERILEAADKKLGETALDQETLIRIQKEAAELAASLLRQEFPDVCATVGI
jgi:hypothetical protein